MMDRSAPDLSIVIVNANTVDLLLSCIESIGRETHRHSYEIFVVDNASVDGSAAAVKHRFPAVTVVENSRDVGFPAANNQALPMTRGRHVILLNPDTVVLEGALDAMIAFLDDQPAVGIVGAKMFDGAMRPWRYETWFLTPLQYLVHPVCLTLWGDVGDSDVDWVCGACLMIRRTTMEQIGPLDSFMFGEDTDWCFRARQAGWSVHHLASARVIHYWGAAASTTDKLAWRAFVTRQSKLYYARKHFGMFRYRMFAVVLVVESSLKVVYLSVRGFAADRNGRLRARAQARGFRRLFQAIVSGTVLVEQA